MSSCLTGGGRAAYRFESLNLDCIKSPSSSASWASNSSSPSSTLSESRNSPLAIATRKPRTPRKRPNQTYNEAAAILSTAYPKIFPTAKHLTEPSRRKLKKSQENTENSSHKSPLLLESSALLMPFQVVDDSGFLLNLPVLERPHLSKGFNPFEKSCLSPEEIDSQGQYSSEMGKDDLEDFDAESILDEEIGEGIDSIMGRMSMENESSNDRNTCYNNTTQVGSFVYGYPVGLGFGYDYRMRREYRAARNVDEGDWWRFPCVNVVDLNPNMHSAAKIGVVNKSKKKKKVENKKSTSEFVAKHSSSSTVKAKSHSSLACKKLGEEDVPPLTNAGLMLKLDYDVVLNTWADKASPFAGDESTGNDVRARLAQIDLFSGGGIREATVLRYKEKRRTRLFSKKIRYHVRKLNADRRPRMKGRFTRTPNSAEE